MRILVTGGVRSGKSRHAERLLTDGPLAGPGTVTYLAPGRPADGSDPDWDARVAAHQERRPVEWHTVETDDLPSALAGAPGPVLVDCLGTWLTARLDAGWLWDRPSTEVYDALSPQIDLLAHAVAQVPRAVVVTNEVGMGVVPAHRSGMLFRDLLGTANQRVAEVCDQVHLVIAGRVLPLSG